MVVSMHSQIRVAYLERESTRLGSCPVFSVEMTEAHRSVHRSTAKLFSSHIYGKLSLRSASKTESCAFMALTAICTA